MTFNRNIAIDRTLTSALMAGAPHQHGERPNWLGHTKRAAVIDEMLLHGATDAELSVIGRPSWRSHIYHLRSEHGLNVLDDGGFYRFGPQETE